MGDNDEDLYQDEARVLEMLDLVRSFFGDRIALLHRGAEMAAASGNAEAERRYKERAARLLAYTRTWQGSAA